MAMQETARSIRLYFVVAGIVGGLVNFSTTVAGMNSGNVLLILLGGVGIAFSAAYIVLGIALPKLLGNGAPAPKLVLGLSVVYMLALAALFLALLPPEQAGASMVQPGIGLLLNWYLWSNLSRLSAEQDQKAAE